LVPLSIAIRAGIAPPGARPPNVPDPTPYDMATSFEERTRFIGTLERFFTRCDVFISPAATVTAFPHCAPGSPIDVDGEPRPSLSVDHPTILSSYTASPSLVVPIALDSRGLP